MGASSIEKKTDTAAWHSTKWWHWLIGLALITLFSFLMPRGKSPEFANLSDGSVSQTKIIAPYDFEILKLPAELEAERQEASDKVLPVIVRTDSIGRATRQELLEFSKEQFQLISSFPENFFYNLSDNYLGDSSRTYLPEERQRIQDGYNQIFNQFGFRLATETWNFLGQLYIKDKEENPGGFFAFFENTLDGILRDIYAQGIINVPKDKIRHSSNQVILHYEGEEAVVDLNRLLTKQEALERISTLLPVNIVDSLFPQGAISAAYEMLQPFIKANIIYDEKEILQRREAAVRKVPTANGLVKKDELIIDKNIRVTSEHLAKLRSLSIKRRELDLDGGNFSASLPIIMNVILFMIIVGVLWVYISITEIEVWRNWKMMLLIAIVFAMVHVFQSLVSVNMNLSRFLFPAAILAMLIGILINRQTAMMCVIAMAFISGLLQGNDLPIAFTSLVIGGVAILAIRYVKTRGDIMVVALYLGVAYLMLIPSLHWGRFTADSPMWADFIVAGANSVLSPILVLGLIFFFEKMFGITTDLSLLELVDLNRPLLRDLAIKSPGTYHHSIMVGSLAEAAARSIGANALLTRAGAYYHDIGKMGNREYFIENQESGTANVHDKLPPSKSARMVINHVTYGLELADKYRLPDKIKAFISEHHGKTRLAFFYAKAVKELGEDVEENKYRYPGPNPQSKETGILMLADVVEAATRSLERKTQADISDKVAELVKVRLLEGDLDDSPLTMKEIAKIRDTFVQVLLGIHHQRIAYPGQQKENPKELSGQTDTPTLDVSNNTDTTRAQEETTVQAVNKNDLLKSENK